MLFLPSVHLFVLDSAIVSINRLSLFDNDIDLDGGNLKEAGTATHDEQEVQQY